MIAAPVFKSNEEFVASLADVEFWRPYASEILNRHSLNNGGDAVAGTGGTYPTFVIGDVVVKLFGYFRQWKESYRSECEAQRALASDPEIKAPRFLAAGQLCEEVDEPWSYIVSERLPGSFWEHAGLSPEQKLSVAAELGEQIRRVHNLRPPGLKDHEFKPEARVAEAAEQSSLPAHLIEEIDAYLSRLGPFDHVFVHGDLMHRHVFIEDDRFAGIIDWGDAMITDRHYELAKLHLTLFNCDKDLLRVFLDASAWPVGDDFAQKAMGLALYRQAHGLAQHHTMDVFYKLPDLFPLDKIVTLDQLADVLFNLQYD